MNYKNIIAFILLFFVQSIAATEDDRPDWLKTVNQEAFCDNIDDYHKAVAESYRNHFDEKDRTIIVGSGRGKVQNTDDGNFSKVAYETPRKYLLVNTKNSGSQPDIKANAENMELEIFGTGYSYIIFEVVPIYAIFAPQAMSRAFKLLRKGGKIVSSTFPQIKPKTDPIDPTGPSCFSSVAQKVLPQDIVKFGGGTCFLPNCLCVFLDDDIYDICERYIDKVDFYNECKQDFLEFLLGSDAGKAKIEFTTVAPNTSEWPLRHRTKNPEVMIITKLSD